MGAPTCPSARLKLPSRKSAHAADFGAEFPGMPAKCPGEVVYQLDCRVIVDERRVALLAESRQPGDIDVGHAPVKRVVARNVDAEFLDHVNGIGSWRDVGIDQTAQP